jgi:LysM repeat protein
MPARRPAERGYHRAQMTERGLPTSDGAPACPFVAFEDDRDERAPSPDHRHRCYAEPSPAPRALAHQEAYCLSSAFPVCPTFQDWARREAARSRSESAGSAEGGAAGLASEPVQRNPPRSWQAPPPWVAGMAGPGPDQDFDDRWERDEEVVAPPPPPPRHAEAEEDDEVEPDEPQVAEADTARGRGLSGSYADRVAAGGAAAAALGPEPPDGDGGSPGPRTDDAQSDWRASAAASAAQPVRPRRERDPDRMAGFTESQSTAPAQGAPGRSRRRDPAAPEWERGRTMEAFPTLRARRLPELSVPPILVSVIALALAAAVLFALPGLLGFGNPGGAVATPTQGLSSSQAPLSSLAPTPVPEPTQQTYTVRDGDTLSRIAKRFGITLDELIAANTETVPDPDKLAVGDVLIIPAADSDELPGET